VHVNLPWVPSKSPEERKREARRKFHDLQVRKAQARKRAKAQWKKFV